MKRSLPKWSGSQCQWTTLILFAVGVCALIAAFLVGIADNLPGIALCYAAVTAFLLAWVHPWRSIKRFVVLLGASLLGFPVAVVLHNLFYALAQLAAEYAVLVAVLGFLEAAFFIVAILVCPPGIVVGAVGAAATAILRARRKGEPDETSS